MIYTLTLNPALDYTLRLDNLSANTINRANEDAIYYGGKGINVSAILSRLSAPTTALGFLAGFTGAELERLLKADGISCDFNYLKSGNTRINVKIKTDCELDINANGPRIENSDIDELLQKLNKIQKNDFLVLAGSIPSSLPSSIYEDILKMLDQRGVHFVVDATGDLLLNTLKFKPFLIKPNHLELGELFNQDASTDEAIVTLSKKLQSLGAKNVLVSRAEKGAILLDEFGNVHKTENAKGKLVNSVGCGDSMVAGFLAGYVETSDYFYSLKLGTACGNATAFSETLATKNEIEYILENQNHD